MKGFENPTLEVVRFPVEDIMTTSTGGSSAEGGSGEWEG